MPRHPSVRIRLDIAYDGTDFSGWAGSPACAPCRACSRRRSRTLFRRTGERAAAHGRRTHRCRACTRSGQVAHVDLDEAARIGGRASAPRSRRTTRRPRRARRGGSTASSGRRAMSSVTHVELAPAGFDARFSAVWRRYEYRIADASAAHDPLERRRTRSWYPRALDVEAMDAAARVAARAARLRRVLQAARGGDDDPHAAGVRLGAATTTACWSRRCRPTRSATAWCARSSALRRGGGGAARRRRPARHCCEAARAHERVHGDARAGPRPSPRSATRRRTSSRRARGADPRATRIARRRASIG